MTPQTHLAINPRLCGHPGSLRAGGATVTLATVPEMAADGRGLVHGGFVFGAADYAAMLAVNDPNVVLGAAESRFLAPVCIGQSVVLDAEVTEGKGRKQTVAVVGWVDETQVFSGTFTTFVLDQHVLG